MAPPTHRPRNLTIQLGPETIRRARLIAARRGTSVSGLVRKTLEDLVEEDSRYEIARQGALRLLHRGFHLGGKRPVPRDELHER